MGEEIFTPDADDVRLQDPGPLEDPIVTLTLAKLYMDQGLYRESAEVFQKLMKKNPSNQSFKQGYASARAQLQGGLRSFNVSGSVSIKEKKIAQLQSWLDSVQRGRKT